jgi:hypothetical protein
MLMVGHLISRFITDDTGFNVANMKLAYNKDISEIRIKKVDSRFKSTKYGSC